MALSQRIGGRYEVRGLQRQTRVGAWHVLSDHDGQPRGGLRLNELNQTEAQRLDAVVRATAGVPGLLKVVDTQGPWLITEQPAAPTLEQTFAARVALPEAVALAIAIDVGEALAALHGSQTAHGSLGPATVVLGADGRAVLAECGYVHALVGTKPGPGHDVTSWAKLLRDLAAPRPIDDAQRLLLRAADTAEFTGGSAGLAEALSLLAADAPRVGGFGERSTLAMLAALVPQPPTQASMVAEDAMRTMRVAPSDETGVTVRIPPPDSAAVTVPVAQSGANALTVPAGSADAATVHVPPGMPPIPTPAGPGHTAIMPEVSNQETLQPAQLAVRANRQKEEVLRYGRGVASLPQQPRPMETTPGWGEQPYARRKRPNRWRRRVFGAISTLTTLVLLAVVAFWLIQRLRPLEVSGATVALAEELGNRCDVQARIVGTITTNGAAGTVTYRWLTSDGRTQGPLSQLFNLGETQQEVPMLWQFRGRGTHQAKATLQILTPAQLEASKEFTYSCG